MAEPRSRSTRPRIWRLQFSLGGIFVLMTLCAIGTWFWYQRPYTVENVEFGPAVDPFAGPSSPSNASLANTRREVTSVRRVWGGKTVRHGPHLIYDGAGNLLLAENYRNGQEDGEFIEYYPTGDKRSLVTYVGGQQHGPARRWSSQRVLLTEENFCRGLRHGRFDYRDNRRDTIGQRLVEGEFDQGRPTGKWTWFSSGVAAARESTKRPQAGKWTWIATHSMIVGQWCDGLPGGRWQWNDAEGRTYLSIDFDHGRVISEISTELDAHFPKLLAKEAGEEPRLLWRLFAGPNLNFSKVPLKDACLYIQELAQVPVRIDRRSLEMAGIPVDLPITYKSQDVPLLIALDRMLKPYALGCDYRYGMLCIDTTDSVAGWKDKTGVTDLNPPRGSRLAKEWNKSTTLEVVQMPLKDVTLYLTEVHSGNIRFDLSRLSAAAKARNDLPGPDSPVTFVLRSITLQNAVAAILDSLACKASLRGETLIVEPQ